jgi:hypothetical protein
VAPPALAPGATAAQIAAANAACFKDIYVAPSINASYIGALARYTWYDYSQFEGVKSQAVDVTYAFDEMEKKDLERATRFCTELRDSTFMKFTKYLNASTTYLWALFYITKHLSIFDINDGTDVPYIDVDSSTPFSVRL